MKEPLVACYVHDTHVSVLFIDFKRACSSIRSDQALHAMKNLNVPNKLISLVAITLKRTSTNARVQGETTNYFEVKKVTHFQRCCSTQCTRIKENKINQKGSIIKL